LLLNATETLFQERYFLARTATPAISLDGLFGVEATTFRQYRWWSLAEIEQTSQVIFPENLPEMLRPLIEAGSGE
jgi:hypothetical protein